MANKRKTLQSVCGTTNQSNLYASSYRKHKVAKWKTNGRHVKRWNLDANFICLFTFHFPFPSLPTPTNDDGQRKRKLNYGNSLLGMSEGRWGEKWKSFGNEHRFSSLTKWIFALVKAIIVRQQWKLRWTSAPESVYDHCSITTVQWRQTNLRIRCNEVTRKCFGINKVINFEGRSALAQLLMTPS